MNTKNYAFVKPEGKYIFYTKKYLLALCFTVLFRRKWIPTQCFLIAAKYWSTFHLANCFFFLILKLISPFIGELFSVGLIFVFYKAFVVLYSATSAQNNWGNGLLQYGIVLFWVHLLHSSLIVNIVTYEMFHTDLQMCAHSYQYLWKERSICLQVTSHQA